MITRQLALAGVAVDDHERRSVGDRPAAEHEVDAQTATLVEVAGPVVPPRVHAIGVVVLAEDVDQAPRLDRGERLAFGRTGVRCADELGRVVHIAVVGCDVEVTGYDDVVGRRAEGLEVGAEPAEPRQLVPVVIVDQRATVRHVDRRSHAHRHRSR